MVTADIFGFDIFGWAAVAPDYRLAQRDRDQTVRVVFDSVQLPYTRFGVDVAPLEEGPW